MVLDVFRLLCAEDDATVLLFVFSLLGFYFLVGSRERKARKYRGISKDKMAEMTVEALTQACKSNKGYALPHLNDQIYLHCKGFMKIQNLEPYTELKALWLEQNCIGDLRGLSAQQKLVSLMIHNNALITLQNFDAPLSNLRILNISHNYLTNLKGIASLCPLLETLQASHNHISSLEACEDLRGVASTLTSVDLSYNEISCCCACSPADDRSTDKEQLFLQMQESKDRPTPFDNSSVPLLQDGSAGAGVVDEFTEKGEKAKTEVFNADSSPLSTTRPRWDPKSGTGAFPSPSSEATTEVVEFFQTHLPQVSVLYLHGNPLLRGLKQYRRHMIVGLPSLTYLDERPIFSEERRVVEAWARGGEAEESAERSKIREEKKSHLQSCVQILTDKMEANREVRDRLTREWEKRRDFALEEAARHRRQVRDAKGVLEVRETSERELQEKEESSAWLDLMDEFESAHEEMEREEKKRFHAYQYEQELAAVTAEVQREIDEAAKLEVEEVPFTTTLFASSLPCADGRQHPLDSFSSITEDTGKNITSSHRGGSRKEDDRTPLRHATSSALPSPPHSTPLYSDSPPSALHDGFTFYELARSDDAILMEMEEEIQNALNHVHTSVTQKREAMKWNLLTGPAKNARDSHHCDTFERKGAHNGEPAKMTNLGDSSHDREEGHNVHNLESQNTFNTKGENSLSDKMARHPIDNGVCAVSNNTAATTATAVQESPSSFRLPSEICSASDSTISKHYSPSGCTRISRDAPHSWKKDEKRGEDKGNDRVSRAVRATATRLRHQAQQQREERWKKFKEWEDRRLGINADECES